MHPIATFTLTGLLMLGTAGASFAQTTTPAPTQRAPITTKQTQAPGDVRADKLIGRNVQNAQNETIGEIKSVMLNQNGSVDSVIVGVGGFLGMGEHEVALGWKDLNVTDNGEKVTTAMTKDQLKALPQYTYADTRQRGTVFSMRGSQTEPVPSTTAMAGSAVGASKLVGLNVRNAQGETIGEIKEVLVAADGRVQSAIVAVGGFLGMGERNVALPWNDLKLQREGDQLRAMVNLTKDQLKTLPEYKERSKGT